VKYGMIAAELWWWPGDRDFGNRVARLYSTYRIKSVLADVTKNGDPVFDETCARIGDTA